MAHKLQQTMKLINNIKKRINNIWLNYYDKILHFLVGYLIASLFQGAGYFMLLPTVIVSTLKEYNDAKRDKLAMKFVNIVNADWMCTVAGGFTALFIYAVSLYYFGVNLPGFITVLINR